MPGLSSRSFSGRRSPRDFRRHRPRKNKTGEGLTRETVKAIGPLSKRLSINLTQKQPQGHSCSLANYFCLLSPASRRCSLDRAFASPSPPPRALRFSQPEAHRKPKQRRSHPAPSSTRTHGGGVLLHQAGPVETQAKYSIVRPATPKHGVSSSPRRRRAAGGGRQKHNRTDKPTEKKIPHACRHRLLLPPPSPLSPPPSHPLTPLTHLSTPERRLRTSTASTNSRRRTRPATPAVPYLSSTSITSTDTCARARHGGRLHVR